MRKNLLIACVAFAVAILGYNNTSHASVHITVAQVGDDVVFKYEGSLDTAGLTAKSLTNGSALYNGKTSTLNTAIAFGVGPLMQGYELSSFATTSNSQGIYATSSEGSGFALFSLNTLALPQNYDSGSGLAGSMTFENKTYASFDFIAGTYKSILPSGDYVEMILDNQNVPEPASAIVFLGLLGGICARRRRSGT